MTMIIVTNPLHISNNSKSNLQMKQKPPNETKSFHLEVFVSKIPLRKRSQKTLW
jgi:hypothetical protein